MTLPVPSIEKQRAIVKEYNTVVNRIQLNEELNQKLEATAQALYKHWFVDFEFPCLPQNYRFSGHVNPVSADMQTENYKFPGASKPDGFEAVLTYKRVGGLPAPDGESWYVYLILCEDDSIYKDMTNDLYRRFYEHYTGQGAKHTQTHKPIKVIHWEQFKNKEEAAQREKELKTGYGRTWISRQIDKAGGIQNLKTGLPAPKTQLRTAGKMVWNEELEKEIPEGWVVDKLGQLIEYVKGFAFKSNIYQIEGYPIVRVSDLTNKSIDFRQCFCLNPKDSHLYEKVNLTHNDIIITSVGSWASNPDSVVGKVIKVPSLKEKAFLNQNMVRLRCKLKEAQLVFYNTLIRKEFSEYIISGAQGSANQASITLKHVFNYNICFPKEHLLKSLSNKFNLINNYSSFREAENDILFELEKHILSKMSKAKTQAQATTA
jgi:type I restriction enzyme S subunit